MIETLRKDLLRTCTKDMDKEPSEVINKVLDGSGKSIWLLSPQLDVLWHSDNTPQITGRGGSYLGYDYEFQMSGLRDFISDMCLDQREKRKAIFKQGIKEYEIICDPIVTEGQIQGYIVTLSEGLRSKLAQFLEKQRVREHNLCQIAVHSKSLPC